MIIVLIGQGTLKPHQNAEETYRKQFGSIMYIDSKTQTLYWSWSLTIITVRNNYIYLITSFLLFLFSFWSSLYIWKAIWPINHAKVTLLNLSSSKGKEDNYLIEIWRLHKVIYLNNCTCVDITEPGLITTKWCW